MDQTQLRSEIEAAFARADLANVREVTRALEKLVRQVEDAAVRRRYEAAIDALPDMVKHLNAGSSATGSED